MSHASTWFRSGFLASSCALVLLFQTSVHAQVCNTNGKQLTFSYKQCTSGNCTQMSPVIYSFVGDRILIGDKQGFIAYVGKTVDILRDRHQSTVNRTVANAAKRDARGTDGFWPIRHLLSASYQGSVLTVDREMTSTSNSGVTVTQHFIDKVDVKDCQSCEFVDSELVMNGTVVPMEISNRSCDFR